MCTTWTLPGGGGGAGGAGAGGAGGGGRAGGSGGGGGGGGSCNDLARCRCAPPVATPGMEGCTTHGFRVFLPRRSLSNNWLPRRSDLMCCMFMCSDRAVTASVGALWFNRGTVSKPEIQCFEGCISVSMGL